MIGIGVDIESIERFTGEDVVKNHTFLNKIYTKEELKYCFSKKNPPQHLAARYAAKEALFKAYSSLGIKIMNYKEIEILNTKQGVPVVNIRNAKIKTSDDVKISLSHCLDKAIAFAFIDHS